MQFCRLLLLCALATLTLCKVFGNVCMNSLNIKQQKQGNQNYLCRFRDDETRWSRISALVICQSFHRVSCELSSIRFRSSEDLNLTICQKCTQLRKESLPKLLFFQAFFSQLLTLRNICEDLSDLIFHPQFKIFASHEL